MSFVEWLNANLGKTFRLLPWQRRMIEQMVWPCDICKETRPDEKISVRKRDTSEAFGLPPGSMSQNIKYCNDRQSCIQGSLTYLHATGRL